MICFFGLALFIIIHYNKIMKSENLEEDSGFRLDDEKQEGKKPSKFLKIAKISTYLTAFMFTGVVVFSSQIIVSDSQH